MNDKTHLVSPSPTMPVESTPCYEGPLETFLITQDSLHTRRAYQRHIREAFRALGIASISELEHPRLTAWRELLMMDGRGTATHAQALSAMRSFLNWYADLGGLPMPHRTMTRVLSVPKVEVLDPCVTLTRSEAKIFLASAIESPRDYALIHILLGAGLHVSEVELLDCTDLRDVDGAPALWIRKGEGGKDRVVPILDEVARAIHVYLLETKRLVTSPGPLFLREDRASGKDGLAIRLGDDGIRRILSKVRMRAFIAKKTSPQVLRQTFGMEFQNHSKDMNLTAKVLGHAPLRTSKKSVDHPEIAEIRAHLPDWGS